MTVSATRASRAGRFVADVIVLGVLLHIILLSAWLAHGVRNLLEERAGAALRMHAVMRAGVSEEQTANFAQRLDGFGLKGRPIGQTEARGLLALQEPWMKSLPNVEIGRLPLLVEIRLPATMRDGAQILGARDKVGAEPEVEFVMFNDNGLEELLAFTSNAKWYASAIQQWLTLIASIGIAIYGAISSRATRIRLSYFVRQLIAFGSALAGADLALRVIASRAAAHYRLPAFELGAAGRELMLALMLWVAACLLIPLVRNRSKAVTA